MSYLYCLDFNLLNTYSSIHEKERERGGEREVITLDTGMYIIRVHAIPVCYLNEIPADSNIQSQRKSYM